MPIFFWTMSRKKYKKGDSEKESEKKNKQLQLL